MAGERGFEHYEVSNLCRNNLYSRHNINYWRQRKYLGVGPAAHSFNLVSRQWNYPDIDKYIQSVNNFDQVYEKELTDESMRFNEYIMLTLRTKWGVDLKYIEEEFGKTTELEFLGKASDFMKTGLMYTKNSNCIMTEKAWFISDHIISRLMK
jgi:oxygen-independent coproporphyrinogen-3 oxidase